MNYASGTPVALGDRVIGWSTGGQFICGDVAAFLNASTVVVRVGSLNTTVGVTGALAVCDGIAFKDAATPALASYLLRADDAGSVLVSGGALPGIPTPSSLLIGLQAWWSLDETTGTRLDATGNGFHLAEVGGMVGTATGVVGNAAAFAVGVGGTPRLQHTGAAVVGGALSMACWINQNSVGALPSNWFGQYSGNSARNVIRTETGSGNLTYNGSLSAGVPLPLGVWTHVAFTCDGTTGKLYLNGSLIATGSQTLNFSAVNNVCVGAIGSGNNPCDGAVDMAGIWNKVLSDAEVGTLVAKDFPFA